MRKTPLVALATFSDCRSDRRGKVKGDVDLSFKWLQLALDGDDEETRYQLQG